MAGLEVCFLPEATILSEGEVTLEWGSPFLIMFFNCHCISLMWLLATLLGTTIARLDWPVWRALQIESVTYEVEDLFGVQL